MSWIAHGIGAQIASNGAEFRSGFQRYLDTPNTSNEKQTNNLHFSGMMEFMKEKIFNIDDVLVAPGLKIPEEEIEAYNEFVGIMSKSLLLIEVCASLHRGCWGCSEQMPPLAVVR